MASSGAERYITLTFKVRETGVSKLSQGMKKLSGNTKKATDESMKFRVMTSGTRRAIGAVRNEILIMTFAFAAFFRTIAGFVKAREMMETFEVRLQVLLGSVSEAGTLFKELATFAGSVPFEYKDIMEAGTQLAGIMRGGSKEIQTWIPLVADLAAATGTSITVTTSQIMRMLSAGAQSADTFREKGVLAMLGFTAGVSYTAEETKKRLMEAWTTIGSQFAGATDKLRTTWTGVISMLRDSWFKFSATIGKELVPSLMRMVNLFKYYVERMATYAAENAEVIREKLNSAIDFTISHLELLKDVLYAIVKPMYDIAKAMGILNSEFVRALIHTKALLLAFGLMSKTLRRLGVAMTFFNISKLSDYSVSVGVLKLRKSLEFLKLTFISNTTAMIRFKAVLSLLMAAFTSFPFVFILAGLAGVYLAYRKINNMLSEVYDNTIKFIKVQYEQANSVQRSAEKQKDLVLQKLRLARASIELNGATKAEKKIEIELGKEYENLLNILN